MAFHGLRASRVIACVVGHQLKLQFNCVPENLTTFKLISKCFFPAYVRCPTIRAARQLFYADSPNTAYTGEIRLPLAR